MVKLWWVHVKLYIKKKQQQFYQKVKGWKRKSTSKKETTQKCKHVNKGHKNK